MPGAVVGLDDDAPSSESSSSDSLLSLLKAKNGSDPALATDALDLVVVESLVFCLLGTGDFETDRFLPLTLAFFTN